VEGESFTILFTHTASGAVTPGEPSVEGVVARVPEGRKRERKERKHPIPPGWGVLVPLLIN